MPESLTLLEKIVVSSPSIVIILLLGLYLLARHFLDRERALEERYEKRTEELKQLIRDTTAALEHNTAALEDLRRAIEALAATCTVNDCPLRQNARAKMKMIQHGGD